MKGVSGRGSKFLNSFWDLAAADQTVRCSAAKRIVQHVQEAEKIAQKDETSSEDQGEKRLQSSDGEYAFQRLVRGLSSSRDSARQGFSACLCQFLMCFSEVEVSTVMQMINDNTRISNGMRGAEERDLMFGKLFGYLALIRSGKLAGANANIVKALDVLIELHQRKAWIREVVSESILILLKQFNFEAGFDTDCALSVVSKLNEILPSTNDFDISEVPAHLLVLLSGLQEFESTVHSACEDNICDAFSSLYLPRNALITADNFASLTSTLLAACSGFPKVHRIWYTILSSIFGGNPEDRHLPSERVNSISSSQESLLLAFVTFIDQNLVSQSSSHEKRGVFLKLVTDLVRLTPSNLIPLVLSKSMVRCIVSIRINKKHTLYALAGAALSTLVASSNAGSNDSESCLTIANTLIKHEGAMFDAKTNSSTVKDLLSDLDTTMVLSYVRNLANIIAKSLSSLSSDNDKGGDEEGVDVKDEGAEQAVSAILALTSIVKNPRMAERGNLAAVIVSILLRLACFTLSGNTPSCVWQVTKKSTKKSKKSTATSPANIFTTLNMDDKALIDSMIDLVKVIESFDISCASSSPKLMNIIASARSSVLNILADVGHVSIDHLNQSLSLMENGKSESDRKRSDSLTGLHNSNLTLLHYAVGIFIHMSETGALVLHSDDMEDEPEGYQCLQKVKVAFQSLLGHDQANSSGDVSSPARLVHSCMNFLGQSMFHVVCSDEVDLDCLDVIAEVISVVPQSSYIKASNDKSLKLKDESAEDENNEDIDEDGFQTALFEACMDLVAVSDKHPVKGVRDATKRLWTSIVQHCVVESSVIEAILSCVVGDDVEGDAEDSRANKAQDDEDDELEEDEDSDDDNDDDGENDENEASDVKSGNKNEKRQEKLNSNEEEDDIMLDEESTMKLLEGDSEGSNDLSDDDNIDEDDMDAALANMIQMRKQNRKQGLQQAKRQELIVRSRAIDILEVFIHRNEETSILLPMFFPLLYCLKKISNSTMVQNLQEGRTFEQRVRSVIENKLCKAKFSIFVEGEEEVNVVLESTSELLGFVNKCLRSARAPMRATATSCFLCISRGIINGNMEGTLGLLASTFQSVLSDYFNKKNSRISVKVIDEMFNRFPEFALTATMMHILQAAESAPSLFLRIDAFRLLGVVLKKSSSLGENCRNLIVDQVDNIIGCTVNTIQAKEDMKAKRMKAIFQFCKDLALYLKNSAAAGSKFSKASIDSLIAALSTSESEDSKQRNNQGYICEHLSSIVSDALISSEKQGKAGKKQSKKKVINDSNVVEKVPSSKKTKKKRSSAEIDDDDTNFVDYEREMINKLAAEAKKHMPQENDDDTSLKKKVKKQKKKK